MWRLPRRRRRADVAAVLGNMIAAGDDRLPIDLRVSATLTNRAIEVHHKVTHEPRPRPARGRMRVDNPKTGAPQWGHPFYVVDGRTSIDIPFFDAETGSFHGYISGFIDWEY